MVSIKDLGSLNYFLGVEVVPTASGVFLSQHKYIQELLNKAHMDGAKEVIVPMSTFAHLLVHDGSPTTDAIEYRRPVSSLQYLSITHPDISFDVWYHYHTHCTVWFFSLLSLSHFFSLFIRVLHRL